MRTIDADKVIEKLKEHKSLFCKNQDEFRALSDKDKARADEIDTCIAELVNAEEVPHAQLGTNLAEVGTDCISRQAAIDAVTEALRGLPVVCKDIAEEAIKQLPPANNSEIPNSSDTISRQQAIDICRAPHMRNADCSDFEMAIMMLPPAQPERIIHCKDCEWWTKQECSPQGRCALSGMYPTGGWFCGNARRREVTA